MIHHGEGPTHHVWSVFVTFWLYFERLWRWPGEVSFGNAFLTTFDVDPARRCLWPLALPVECPHKSVYGGLPLAGSCQRNVPINRFMGTIHWQTGCDRKRPPRTIPNTTLTYHTPLTPKGVGGFGSWKQSVIH